MIRRLMAIKLGDFISRSLPISAYTQFESPWQGRGGQSIERRNIYLGIYIQVSEYKVVKFAP